MLMIEIKSIFKAPVVISNGIRQICDENSGILQTDVILGPIALTVIDLTQLYDDNNYDVVTLASNEKR